MLKFTIPPADPSQVLARNLSVYDLFNTPLSMTARENAELQSWIDLQAGLNWVTDLQTDL